MEAARRYWTFVALHERGCRPDGRVGARHGGVEVEVSRRMEVLTLTIPDERPRRAQPYFHDP